jgi:hypothetical protein
VVSSFAGSVGWPVLLLAGPVGTSLVDAVRLCEDEQARIALANKVVNAVLAILRLAHTRGIIHCDVRPANIVLTRDGDSWKVYLVDWGVCRDCGESARGIGVPAYAAPGVFAGAAYSASPAMDVCGALCTWIAIVHGGAAVEVPWITTSSDSVVDGARTEWLDANIGLVGVSRVRTYLGSGGVVYEFSVEAAAAGAADATLASAVAAAGLASATSGAADATPR